MQKLTNAKKGFTLIELLTVIAILAILGAIIFPTVGQFRTLAKKTSDANDLRNIVSASQMFASQNGERFVDVDQTISTNGVEDTGTPNELIDVAAVLAFGGELKDPGTWISANDSNKTPTKGALYTSTVDDSDPLAPVTNYDVGGYANSDFSFSYVTGLKTFMPATTPVAFTAITSTASSTWGEDDTYNQSGGHIAFLGGSVSWYEDLTGKLISPDGDAVNNLAGAVTAANIRQP